MTDDQATRGVKGGTTFFFAEKTIDILLAMVMTLGSEITALSERLETVIDLLEARGLPGPADIEGFTPSPAQQARRDTARSVLIETLLAPYQQQADMLARQEE